MLGGGEGGRGETNRLRGSERGSREVGAGAGEDSSSSSVRLRGEEEPKGEKEGSEGSETLGSEGA